VARPVITREESTAPGNWPAIALRGVAKSFDENRRVAIHGLNLQIAKGELVSIIGASGSGKTTLLKMINRLIEPDAGEIAVEGEPVGSVAPHVLRRRIGYVFQGIGLFPHMTIAQNIGITPQLLGWDKPTIAQRTHELLDLVHLSKDFAHRMPHELSGGQRQRIGVARALAARPKIMLMDEPFGALDPLTRDALASEFRRLHEQMALTTLMVTHDVLEALLLSDRIVVLHAGQVIAEAAPRDLLSGHSDPRVLELIGTPTRQALRVRALMEGQPARG
jgi:osmoprotectant transport system ATP-binding protein